MAETFQRARSEEQREIRRAGILETASTMLREAPVAALTLNELARRVGLAKSNVLRYFESREAVLLDLLTSELGEWLTALQAELGQPGDATSAETRRARLVSVLVETLKARPVLCDLLSAQAGVLERNVSPAIAAAYKRNMLRDLEVLAVIIRDQLPELPLAAARHFATMVMLMAGAVWTHSTPSEAMKTAYLREPELAALALDFGGTLGGLMDTFLKGLGTESGGEPRRS